MAQNEPIFLGNAYRAQCSVTHRTTDTGADANSTGLTLTILLTASSESTTPIAAALSATASELGTTGGTYYTVFAGSDISTGNLGAYEDSQVFIAYLSTEIRVHHPVQVLGSRRPR